LFSGNDASLMEDIQDHQIGLYLLGCLHGFDPSQTWHSYVPRCTIDQNQTDFRIQDVQKRLAEDVIGQSNSILLIWVAIF